MNLPIVISVPIGLAIVALLLRILRRTLMASRDRRNPQLRVDALAKRLGLHVIEGDPSLNLTQAEFTHLYTHGGTKHTRVLLQGEPFGRPMKFLFDYRSWAPGWVAEGGEEFVHRFSVAIPPDVPAFEIVRSGWSDPDVVTLGLPRQSLGDPGLDAAVQVRCGDPGLVRTLAPAVAGLHGHSFVHIRCLHATLSSLATKRTTSQAIHHIVETQRVLHEIADVLWRLRTAQNVAAVAAPVSGAAPAARGPYVRLQQLAPTPRPDIEGLGFRPLAITRGTRRAWTDAMTNGPLVLQYVVQAHQALYEPSDRSMGGAVVLFTADPVRCRDGAFLRAVAEYVQAVKDDPGLRDDDLTQVQRLLSHSRSLFDITLPSRLSSGVPTTMRTVSFSSDELPGRCIPPHRLIPAVIGPDAQLFSLRPTAYL